MIFETHAHYDDDRFKDDRDETIKRVHEKGVAPIINVGASIGSTMTTIELDRKSTRLNSSHSRKSRMPSSA